MRGAMIDSSSVKQRRSKGKGGVNGEKKGEGAGEGKVFREKKSEEQV